MTDAPAAKILYMSGGQFNVPCVLRGHAMQGDLSPEIHVGFLSTAAQDRGHVCPVGLQGTRVTPKNNK